MIKEHIVCVDRHGQCTVTWTADYGLGIKQGLRCKPRTKRYRLNIK